MKKVLLCSLGSRGDVEPFLALGEELIAQGDTEVAFCLSEQFRELAGEVSPHFYPQTSAFLDLMDSPEIKAVMGQVGSAWTRWRTMMRLLKDTAPIQRQLILDQKEAIEAFEPDEVIFHTKCLYPMFWFRMGNKARLLTPIPCMIIPVDHEPHIGFGKPGPRWWNRLTYRIAMMVMVRTFYKYGNSALKPFNMSIKKKEVRELYRNGVPIEFAVDEGLFERPDYWLPQHQVSSFRTRSKNESYEPEQRLTNFLEQHPSPLYVGFGSMVNAKPKQVGQDILDVCKELQLPVILNKSWGGIEVPNELDESVYVTSNIPFDYLFPKVRAAVHHGGSGTVHYAFRAGIPQMIIPHIADQYYWSRTVVKVGNGVPGFPIKKWSKERFRKGVVQLLEMSR